MLRLTIDGQNYKIRFGMLVIMDSDIITRILEDTQNRVKTATAAEIKRTAMLNEINKAEEEGRVPDLNIDEIEAFTMDMYRSIYDTALNSMRITAELLAAGLQKYHKEEFGYYIDDPDDPNGNPIVDEAMKAKVIRKCYELIDAYEDDATDEQRENGEHDSTELYNLLNQELERNGFLSRVSQTMAQTAEQAEATMIPQDHKRKKSSQRKTKVTEIES